MGWRLHLSNQPVTAVQLIPGEPPQVAVWNPQRGAHFYHAYDATPSGVSEFAPPDFQLALDSDPWRAFVDSLRAPNGSPLPRVSLGGLDIHSSRDGRMHLYHYSDGRLMLQVDDTLVRLDREEDGQVLVADMDRALGLIGLINEFGDLIIFQQHVRVGAFPLALTPDLGMRLSIAVPDAGGRIVVSDGEQVLITDAAGQVLQQSRLYYVSGTIAVSPNGQAIAIADIDDNVVRVYSSDLRPTAQKHAIDLVSQARQVQLIASMPDPRVAVGALAVSDDGTLAFALGGVVCVSALEALDELPQPRPLF